MLFLHFKSKSERTLYLHFLEVLQPKKTLLWPILSPPPSSQVWHSESQVGSHFVGPIFRPLHKSWPALASAGSPSTFTTSYKRPTRSPIGPHTFPKSHINDPQWPHMIHFIHFPNPLKMAPLWSYTSMVGDCVQTM